MALQDLLLDELNHSEEMFDNDLYLSMKGFWELFIGEITHKYTCTRTSCEKNSFKTGTIPLSTSKISY